VCVCVVAVRVHLPCFHLLLVHAGGGGAAPVRHSQSQGAPLCFQPAGQPLGEHVPASGFHQGQLTVCVCVCVCVKYVGHNSPIWFFTRLSSLSLVPRSVKESNLHPDDGTPGARPAEHLPRHGGRHSSAHPGGQAV